MRSQARRFDDSCLSEDGRTDDGTQIKKAVTQVGKRRKALAHGVEVSVQGVTNQYDFVTRCTVAVLVDDLANSCLDLFDGDKLRFAESKLFAKFAASPLAYRRILSDLLELLAIGLLDFDGEGLDVEIMAKASQTGLYSWVRSSDSRSQERFMCKCKPDLSRGLGGEDFGWIRFSIPVYVRDELAIQGNKEAAAIVTKPLVLLESTNGLLKKP